MLIRYFKLLITEEGRFRRNEDGQILVFTALAGLALVMMVATVFNIGIVVGEKMKVQNAADTAAYSQAVWEARMLNFVAYTNRAILSHMVTIAFCTAVFSQERLWNLIENVSNAILAVPVAGQAVGPFLVAVARFIHWLWIGAKFVANIVREAANIWVQTAPLLFQMLPLIEVGARIMTNSIGKKVVGNIDPDITLNQGWGTLLSLKNTFSFGRILSYSTIPVGSITHVYRESCDGFSIGTSFPRTINVGIKPLFQFGPKGDLIVHNTGIEQVESVFLNMFYFPTLTWRGIKWDWWFKFSVPLVNARYSEPQLISHRFWNYKFPSKNYFSDPNRFPSVYILAKKNKEDVKKLQIPLLGSSTSYDIYAIARAQVFYWDPDRNRSQRLRSGQYLNIPHEPNLFNPFWHARLAPMDAIFRELGVSFGGLESLVLAH